MAHGLHTTFITSLWLPDGHSETNCQQQIFTTCPRCGDTHTLNDCQQELIKMRQLFWKSLIFLKILSQVED